MHRRKESTVDWRLVISICVGCIVLPVCRWDQAPPLAASAAGSEDARFEAAAEQEAHRRTDLLTREIADLGDHAWAGEYRCGGGLVHLRLLMAPANGYVYQFRGCLGVYERNYGAVTVDGDRIRMAFTFPNDPERMGLAAEYLVVRWGQRRYLVPSNDVIGFCNQVNAGYEPRASEQGFVMLRMGDANDTLPRQPDLPPAYRDYLLPNPVEAEIIAVGEPELRPSVAQWKFKDTLVTVNAGADHGLKSGMEMHFIGMNMYEEVTLVAVWPERSQALLSQTGEDTPTPQIGWRLSTRSPYAR